jgi:serine O-acetyltransferase
MMRILDDLNARFERLLFAGRTACLLYRISHAVYRAGIPFLPYLIQWLNALLHGIEIHYRARIGKGLQIAHPRGIVIGRNVEAGRNLRIYTGAVLGVKTTGTPAQPRIGDHVAIYAGAKILGGVTIGDHATIAANAVVTHDVEPYAIVTGVPARVVRIDEPEEGRDEPVVAANQRTVDDRS